MPSYVQSSFITLSHLIITANLEVRSKGTIGPLHTEHSAPHEISQGGWDNQLPWCSVFALCFRSFLWTWKTYLCSIWENRASVFKDLCFIEKIDINSTLSNKIGIGFRSSFRLLFLVHSHPGMCLLIAATPEIPQCACRIPATSGVPLCAYW